LELVEARHFEIQEWSSHNSYLEWGFWLFPCEIGVWQIFSRREMFHRTPEQVRILAVVVAIRELVPVARQVLHAHLVERADERA